MSINETDYDDKVAVWPAPLELKHQNGETFVTLLQKENYIEAKWVGHITAGDVITTCKAYLAVLEKHPCPGLLNNKTDVTGDWADANDWLEFEWLPRATVSGLRCLAHVYSNNMFSRLSARDLYLRLTPRLQMNNFYDRQAAANWLQSCLLAAEEETSPTS